MDLKTVTLLVNKIGKNSLMFLVAIFILFSSLNLFAQSVKQKEFFNSGLTKAKAGQLDGAIADFTESIKAAETDSPEKLVGDKPVLTNETKLLSQTYYYRGVALAATGKKEDAVNDLDKAIKYDLNFIDAYVLRGKTCNDIGDYKRANDNLKVASTLFPSNFDVWLHLGIANQNLDNDAKAVEYFNSAIKIKSDNVQGYIERSKCYLKLEKYDEALVDANKAVSMDSKNSDAYLCRGVIYRYMEEYEFAIRDYTSAVTYNPNNAVAFYNRGIAHSKVDEHQKAIQDYSKAIEISPEDDEAYLNRGIEKLILDKPADACSDIKVAADLGNKNGKQFFQNEGKVICNQ
jgi:tetratricopeptide (TPR) repeat protein